ncbi:MAG: M20/M25/M40 family metallo-hydrolase [Bacteroidota bacterium]
MFTRKSTIVFFVFILIGFTVLAQNQALSIIDKEDLKRHLTFIASDDLQGRKLGTEVDGLGITANYLAEYVKKIGLKPGAENYFQKVEMVSSKPNENNFIEVKNSKGKTLYKSGSIVCLNSNKAFGNLKDADVIVAGFGDETDGIDIDGKVVVIAQGNIESFKKGNLFRWNNRLERSKIESISEQKPRTIVIVTNPQDKDNRTFSQIKAWFGRERFMIKTAEENKEAPVLVTIPKFADELLGGKGKYKEYLTGITENSKPNNFEVENRNVNPNAENITELVDAKNVIAVIEGSDSELKNEFVVFMAHYDHLGVSKDGDVYNGADDNGSGTVALMEVAEAFAGLEKKPKRSIVFLWVTCEEIGMLGSEYYVEHPVFPLEKTIACVNLDMVGRVFEPRDTVWNRSPKRVKDFDGLFTLSNDVWPELAEISAQKCAELGLVPDTTLPAFFMRSSDHYQFHRKGVPVLNLATGYHADYHKVGDEGSKINFDKIKRVADLCFLLGYEIANKNKIELKRETE